jgi:hypothetical protein
MMVMMIERLVLSYVAKFLKDCPFIYICSSEMVACTLKSTVKLLLFMKLPFLTNLQYNPHSQKGIP